MEFSLDPGSATYKIKSYHEGCVNINGQDYTESLIIMPEKLILNWKVKSIEDLTIEHFKNIAELLPQVVIVGIGNETKHLDKKILAPLLEKNIGVEIMSMKSACRTYTILMSEGRNVAACLILLDPG